MAELIVPQLYLSFICTNVECLRRAERDIKIFDPRTFLVDSEGEMSRTSSIINDTDLLQSVETAMDEIHKAYPRFRYFLTVEDESSKGNYRVYVNKKGKKIITKAARKRLAFNF